MTSWSVLTVDRYYNDEQKDLLAFVPFPRTTERLGNLTVTAGACHLTPGTVTQAL
jgi:hypothetical protein